MQHLFKLGLLLTKLHSFTLLECQASGLKLLRSAGLLTSVWWARLCHPAPPTVATSLLLKVQLLQSVYILLFYLYTLFWSLSQNKPGGQDEPFVVLDHKWSPHQIFTIQYLTPHIHCFPYTTRLEMLEAGAKDGSEFMQWQQSMRQKDMDANLADIERRRLEGKLSHEEAILARQNLIQDNRQKVQEMKEEVGASSVT